MRQEILAIDAAVVQYNQVAMSGNVPTVRMWEVLVELFEAIETYLATKRGHKQPRLDAVNDLRAVTMRVRMSMTVRLGMSVGMSVIVSVFMIMPVIKSVGMRVFHGREVATTRGGLRRQHRDHLAHSKRQQVALHK